MYVILGLLLCVLVVGIWYNCEKDRYSYITHEDTHCVVHCECGREVDACHFEIRRCKCGNGFNTSFYVNSFRKRKS